MWTKTMPWITCCRCQSYCPKTLKPRSRKQCLSLSFIIRWLKKMCLKYLEPFLTCFVYKHVRSNFSWVNSRNIDLRTNKSRICVWIPVACSDAKLATSKASLTLCSSMELMRLRRSRYLICYLNLRYRIVETFFIRK